MLVDAAVILALRGRFDGEPLDAGAVDEEFDVVGTGDAFDMFVAVAGEADLDFVFGVDGEGVTERLAAARAEGKAFELVFLGEVGGQVEGFAIWGAGWDADGKAADFACGAQIAFEEGRREIADGDVIEAAAGFIGGEEIRDVNFEGEEVADGVLVFGAVKPAEGVSAAGVGLLAVKSGFNGLDRSEVGVFGGAWNSYGRHGSAAEAAEYFFPAFGVFGGSGGVEAEIAVGRCAVVAAEAVFADEGLLGRLCGEAECGQRREAIQGPERETAHAMNYTGWREGFALLR